MTLETALEILEKNKEILPPEDYIKLKENIEEANNTVYIYRLVCNKTDLLYVGQTTLTLSQRKALHKSEYKRKQAGKIDYKIRSFLIIKNGDFRIEKIEMCSEKKADEREQHYIRELECVNYIQPTCRTYEEYLQNTNATVRIRSRNEFENERKKFDCSCGKSVRITSKRDHLKTNFHQKHSKE